MEARRDGDHAASEELVSVSKAKLGTADIVVLVLDTRDAGARDVAQAILERSGDLDLDREEARILRKPDVVPTGLAVIPLAAATAGFAVSHPRVAEGLRTAPSVGRFRVVVVATGGATLVHLPVATIAAAGTA